MSKNKKNIAEAILKARERGVSDEEIVRIIKNKNPKKLSFFNILEKRGLKEGEILDEIIQDKKEESNPYSLLKPFSGNIKAPLKSKLKYVFLGTFLFFGGVFAFLFFYFRTPLSKEITERDFANFQLSRSEVAGIIEPSVVKIGYAISGNVEIEPFNINLENFHVTRSFTGETSVLPLEEIYWEGTGFVVDPHGLILTNAHVVNSDYIKKSLALQIFASAIMEEQINLIWEGRHEEAERVERRLEEVFEEADFQEAANMMRASIEGILNVMSFDVQEKGIVFNPSSESERINELTQEGFPFEILEFDLEWFYNYKDVALIKIEEENLPAAYLGDSSSARIGGSIYNFGFPATSGIMDTRHNFMRGNFKKANIFPNIRIGGSYLRPSFTSGVITSLKEEPGGQFDYIETDAKASPGSSGSPIINEAGEVIAILSVGTPEMEGMTGDSFSRAIPINLFKEMSDIFSQEGKGDYYNHFKRGLYFMHEKKCKNALEEFDLAIKGINENFRAKENVKIFKERCNDLIDIGASIDNRWDEMMENLFGG